MAKHLNRAHGLTFEIIDKNQKMNEMPAIEIIRKLSETKSIEISTTLALSLATTSAPYRLVDNENFIKFVKLLSSNYKLPTTSTICTYVDQIYENLLKTLKFDISNASSVSMCIDFWSGADRLGYIGIVLSYVKDLQKRDRLIALRYVPSPHTSDKIIEVTNQILSEFSINGIEDKKVFTISTDNGSNMVKAYSSITPLDSANDEFVVESTLDGNVFESIESGFRKRIACIDHLMNNNLKFAIKKEQSVLQVIEKMLNIVKSLKYNGRVNDYLKDKGLSMIKLPPPTRWQYHYESIHGFLSIKDHLPILCTFVNRDNLQISEYSILEQTLEILNNYKNVIQKFEQRDCKLSEVIPEILTLLIRISRVNNDTKNLALELKNDLLKRTRHIFDPQSPSFNEVYSFATFLDPETNRFLDICDQQIIPIKLSDLKNVVSSKLANLFTESENEPASKLSKYHDLEALLNYELSTENELSKYKTMTSNCDNLTSLISFWKQNESNLPKLSQMGMRMATASPSSAVVENAFSIAALSNGVRRMRISCKRLEQEAMIKFNLSDVILE